eukprot:symbB.v1.2.009680.t1/scaffold589.1/size183863/15
MARRTAVLLAILLDCNLAVRETVDALSEEVRRLRPGPAKSIPSPFFPAGFAAMANPKGHLPGCMCKACRASTLEAAAGFLSGGCGLIGPGDFGCNGCGGGTGGAASSSCGCKVIKKHLPGCICKECRDRPENSLDAMSAAMGVSCGPCGPANAAKLAAAVGPEWWNRGDWWDDWWDDGSWWAGWEDNSWWPGSQPVPNTAPPAMPPMPGVMPDLGVPATASIQPTVSALPAPVSDVATAPQITPASPLALGDMKEEVLKFCEKFDLKEDNQKAIIASLEKCGETWVKEMRDLDHALSKARNPGTLLQARLREIESLRGFKEKAKNGHLPGCMCPTCKELSFQRAVGVTEGNNEAKSLNAAALFAYQNEQEALGAGPSEEQESAFKEPALVEPKKGKGKGKPLVLPTGELLPEVKAFCARFALTDRLQTKVMDTLRKRQDHEWRQDLAEMNRDLSKARNPSGLLVVKLGDIQKELNPNQLCFNYRAGSRSLGKFGDDSKLGFFYVDLSNLLYLIIRQLEGGK